MNVPLYASAMEFAPIVLIMSMGMPNVSYDNGTSNFSGNHTRDYPTDGGDSSDAIEAYTLYKITYYMADNYLWVVLAFGVPGNLASIFTILSMTTVSSSKVVEHHVDNTQMSPQTLYFPSAPPPIDHTLDSPDNSRTINSTSEILSTATMISSCFIISSVNTYVLRHRTSAVDPPEIPKIRPGRKDVGPSNEIQRPKMGNISTNVNSRSNKTLVTMSVVGGKKSVNTVNIHVAILALTDTMAIIVKVIYWQASGHFIQLTIPGCALIMFIQQFSTAYANWVVVAMTTERFLAVWFPLRVGRMYTRRKAIFTLASLACITAAVYSFFFWSWTEYYEEGYGYWCEMKPTYTTFIMGTFYWIEGLYFAILPCLLILVGNTLIITNIKRATKIQRHLTNSFDQGGRKTRDQRQITVMLVVVSVIFLLLNMPTAILYFVRPSWNYQKQSYEEVEYMFTSRLIHMLADANHAVNFYLYFLSMSSFRRRFMDAIRCRQNKYSGPAGGSVSRTSHSFLNSAQHATGYGRRHNNGNYNTYMRSNNKHGHHALPLETYMSKENGGTCSHQIQGFRESNTNISDV